MIAVHRCVARVGVISVTSLESFRYHLEQKRSLDTGPDRLKDKQRTYRRYPCTNLSTKHRNAPHARFVANKVDGLTKMFSKKLKNFKK